MIIISKDYYDDDNDDDDGDYDDDDNNDDDVNYDGIAKKLRRYFDSLQDVSVCDSSDRALVGKISCLSVCLSVCLLICH